MKKKEKFLYLEISRDTLSRKEMSSLLVFEQEIHRLCKLYYTTGATVIPAISNIFEVVSLVDWPKGIINGNYIVPFMIDEECGDNVVASAQHEFLHIFFIEHPDVRREIINDICPQLQIMVDGNNALLKTMEKEMVYLHDCLCGYMNPSLSTWRRLKMAEEIVCELASHVNSPAKDKVFDMVVNGNWNDNDLFTIFASISTM